MSNIVEISNNVFYSPIPDEYDTRPAEIFTFKPLDRLDLVNDLNNYITTLKEKDDHRLIKNYLDIDFVKMPFVSVWKRDGNVTGFSTGYTRDFYINNSVRIFNRFYHDKKDSRINFTRELLRPSTFNCIQQQLLIAERLGYTFGFISREVRAKRFFKMFIDALDKRSKYDWEYKEGPFLVAPKPNDVTCWQSIGLVKFKDTDIDFWRHWKCKQN